MFYGPEETRRDCDCYRLYSCSETIINNYYYKHSIIKPLKLNNNEISYKMYLMLLKTCVRLFIIFLSNIREDFISYTLRYYYYTVFNNTNRINQS